MVKIALDAGHGFNTPGKRTPDGEREWSFNNKVLLSCAARLSMYQNIDILRLDDSTGKTDTPLATRTNQANRWGADVLVSIHHNAFAGKWGSHGGVETYVDNTASQASKDIAAIVNPMIVAAMGLRNRGVKSANLHMTRESRMPAILTEGGFMDSTTDIAALRSDAKLKAQGVAIADGLAQYYKLGLKSVENVLKKEDDEMAQQLPQTQKDDMRKLLQRAYDEKVFKVDHTPKVDKMTRGQATDLMISYVARTK